jgi:predicted transcriptional regulator
MAPLKAVRFATASTVMKKNVVTIDGKKTVANAIKLMKEKKVSSLLVDRRGQEDT